MVLERQRESPGNKTYVPLFRLPSGDKIGAAW